MARALVIEDDDGLRESLLFVLGLWGFDTSGTPLGREGVGIVAEEGPFDLAVVDLELPDVRGEDVVRRLRSTADVTLVAMSGEHERLRALPQGLVDASLPKPFTFVALRDCLEAVHSAPGPDSFHTNFE